ncbi:beta-galactosidase [Solihabitans fulvus]|uniref:Beta-galactosidase n=1 Tax=Solihabitans fulvus TaxID=1892852 RepID=A0A5B2XCU0_9PSEU|nr:beta-galactosidase [Solihabitans fulvus]KAA2261477.1 beta-galactosidase [Solihabitans fulvus]
MITRVEGLLYGADYNAEQWPESVWEQDAKLMREAGVTMVTLGVFSWARVQPSEDEWDFGWLDRLLDLFHANGIAVDLATASASPPAWLVRKYPEVLPVTADGVRLEFGSRQHYCPSSPIFRAAATRLARALAQRYGSHPALALWHIHNEYGDHVTECFCAESASDFRRWLLKRYADDIERLNFAWGTEFWAQRYSSFDQVEPPRTAPGPVNPGQVLDWRRFCSDALLACFLDEREVLRELSPQIPVTTNFMSMFKALDYWTWAAHEDLVSDDAYPDPSGASDHVLAAMNYDLMRSLGGGRPWLLMEQAPSAVSWRTVNVPKPPGLHRLWSLQTVAHGADGVMYFQWRASRAGAEKFHSALLPHGGTATRGWRETVRFGAELRRLAEVAGSRSSASVAVVLDWNSWWALEMADHPSARVKLKEQVLGWYSALHARNVAVDFVPPGAPLEDYRLVLCPNLYSVSVPTAEWLTSYVAGGGRLVCGFFSGIVDELDHIHQSTDGSGGGYPGPLREVLGVVVDEFWPVADGDAVPVLVADNTTAATVWSEWLDATTATTTGWYAGSGPLAGRPAITRNAHGSGEAWYVSCQLGAGIDVVLAEALGAAGIEPVLAVPAGVEVTRRTGPDAAYLFLLNQNHDSVDLASLPPGAVDLLSDNTIDTTLRLPALGAAVLRIPA